MMDMRMVLIAGLILIGIVTTTTVYAANVKSGPYNISFDLEDDYLTMVGEPYIIENYNGTTATVYSLLLAEISEEEMAMVLIFPHGIPKPFDDLEDLYTLEIDTDLDDANEVRSSPSPRTTSPTTYTTIGR